eukprot:4365622-Amphidinium_carterae.1
MAPKCLSATRLGPSRTETRGVQNEPRCTSRQEVCSRAGACHKLYASQLTYAKTSFVSTTQLHFSKARIPHGFPPPKKTMCYECAIAVHKISELPQHHVLTGHMQRS